MVDCDKDIKDLKVLISEENIQSRIKDLAEKIEKVFPENEDVYVICVLKGSSMFFIDLIKHFKHNVQF